MYNKLSQESKLAIDELQSQLKVFEGEATRLSFEIGGLEDHLA